MSSVAEPNGIYYQRRAEEELREAELAGDYEAAEAHRELARKYLALATVELERNRSTIALGWTGNDNAPPKEEPPAGT